MSRGRAVFLLGASGVGKTAVARRLEGRDPWVGRVHFFDSIGVPTPDRMVNEWGSGEAWQRWATEEWVRRLVEGDERLQLLEGQTRPSFVNEALGSNSGLEAVVILLNCSAEVRRYRLELRGQRELGSARMETWAAYLSGQADALGLPVIDTDGLEIAEVADRVEAIGLDGLSAGSL